MDGSKFLHVSGVGGCADLQNVWSCQEKSRAEGSGGRPHSEVGLDGAIWKDAELDWRAPRSDGAGDREDVAEVVLSPWSTAKAIDSHAASGK